MRAAHSIKGGAASVELPAIKAIAHRLEDIFKALYNDAVVVDETMESLLLESFDCLKDALMTQIDTGELDHDGALEKALPLITAIEEQLGDYLAAGEQFLPSSADLGVDIVSSLFEVDIVQGIEQLQIAYDSGDRPLISETLQGQTEVFAGLAEILNLTGFKAITDLVQQGIAQPDCDPMSLANLALTDWRDSCEQVLQNGDRQRGGEPSAALIALVNGGEVGEAAVENGSDSAFTGFEDVPDLGDMFGGFGDMAGENGSEFAGMEFPALDEPAEDNVFAGMEFPDLETPDQPSEENVFAGMEFPDLGTVESAEDNVFAGMEFPDLETPDQPSEENVFVGMEFPDLDEAAEDNVFAGMEFPDLEPVAADVNAPQTTTASTEDFPPEVVSLDDPPYHFFIEEAPELLQAIENGLLTIRQDRSAAKVHEIMRAAHSLKGGAASVGLNGIKSVAHRLEDIFKALYSDDLVIDETLETRLLEAYDALRQPLEEQINTGYYDPNAAWQQAQPIITAIETQLGDRLAAGDQFMPSSADLGVDIVSSLFDVDIRQGIEEIRTARQSGDQVQLSETLSSQTEVFLGLAEILNLPGFKGIAEAVQQALEVNPDQLLGITDQALIDWQNSCEQVLQNGDRQQGGSASAQLLALGVLEEKETLYQPSSSPKVLSDLFFGDDDEEEEEETPAVEAIEPVIAETPTLDPEIIATPTEDSPLVTLSDAEADDAFAALMDLGDELTETEALETEIAADSVINREDLPSLEDVFGGLTPDSAQADETIVAGVEILDTTEADANLLAMVQSVEQVFEQLPVEETAVPETTPAPTETPVPEHTPERRAAPRQTQPANLSIRVDFQWLERMNNWVGELAINRNSLSLQNDQLQGSVRSLLSRFSRFQGMTNKLRELADQLVIAPDRREKMAWISNAFDSLEMDSYGALSGQLQEILEEMMQLEEAVDDIVLFARASNQSLDAQKQMLFSLRDELMWARMLPLGEILNRFPRVLRDMSTKFKKPVQLKLNGTAVLVDRLALEKLNDPLMHLLRNAFDHGIESSEERRAAGKPETGTIEIAALHQGNQTIIEIRDDGGGLNPEKILQRAIERGLVTQEQGDRLTPDQIQNLIFEPNFSTADQVSELSGRGVGLDVVRQQLQALKGNIVVSSRLGRGSTFSLRLPLTLTIAKVLVCLVGQSNTPNAPLTAIAIPSDSVAELLVPLSSQIKTSGGQRFLLWQHLTVPIYPPPSTHPLQLHRFRTPSQ